MNLSPEQRRNLERVDKWLIEYTRWLDRRDFNDWERDRRNKDRGTPLTQASGDKYFEWWLDR